MRAASRANDLARLSNGCGTAVAMEGLAIVDVVFSLIRVGAPWDPIRKGSDSFPGGLLRRLARDKSAKLATNPG